MRAACGASGWWWGHVRPIPGYINLDGVYRESIKTQGEKRGPGARGKEQRHMIADLLHARPFWAGTGWGKLGAHDNAGIPADVSS